MRKFLIISLILISSPVHADMRAVYGLDGKPTMIVDVRDRNTMRVSYPNEFDYIIIDNNIDKNSIFQVYKQDKAIKITTVFGNIRAAEDARTRIFQNCGLLIRSKVTIPILEKLTVNGREKIGKFVGNSFDLEIKRDSGLKKYHYVQFYRKDLSEFSEVLLNYEILRYFHSIKFQASESVENSLLSAYKTIYKSGIPMIWPQSNLRLISVDNLKIDPNHYSLPSTSIEPQFNIKEIEAQVYADLEKGGIKCDK